RIRNGEIRMVIGRLSAVSDGVHEHECRRPPVSLVDPAYPLVLVIPSWQAPETLCDLFLVVGLFFCRHSGQSHLNAGWFASRQYGTQRVDLVGRSNHWLDSGRQDTREMRIDEVGAPTGRRRRLDEHQPPCAELAGDPSGYGVARDRPCMRQGITLS